MTRSDTVQQRLLRSFWADGLLDILVGVGLLIVGIAWMAGFLALAPVCAPLLIVLWRPLRQRIVEPRAGYVRFLASQRRETRSNLLAVVSIGVVSLAAVLSAQLLTTTGALSPPQGRWVAALPAGIVAFGLAITAGLTGARRFYFYAAALLGMAQVTSALMDRPDVPLLAGGVLILVRGIMLLVDFIRQSAELPLEAE